MTVFIRDRRFLARTEMNLWVARPEGHTLLKCNVTGCVGSCRRSICFRMVCYCRVRRMSPPMIVGRLSYRFSVILKISL